VRLGPGKGIAFTWFIAQRATGFSGLEIQLVITDQPHRHAGDVLIKTLRP
jgi:hypothetical protein